MPDLLSPTPLLLDASCVISLYASSQMEPILRAYPAQIGVVDVVRTGEILDVWDGSDENVRQHKSTVNLLSFIAAGVLVEAPFENIDVKMVLNLAAHGLNNGECATMAVAYRLGWGLGIDNVSAWRRIAALLPQVSLVSTSQLLKHWADTQHITLKDVCTALQSMRRRGGYRFQKHDPLGDWLQQLIDGSHKTTPNKQNLG
jgi:hypothetical protein